ncbi:hypothetical protein BH09ACT1_BH09ACT1_01750 [soil metagenome]
MAKAAARRSPETRGEGAPPARSTKGGRGQRSRWFDPRLAIGLGLVVASLAGVLVVVSRADSTIAVLSARVALFAGDRVSADDVVERRVRLDGLADDYLVAEDLPRAGLIITKPVAIGELVPVSAVGNRSGVRKSSIVVPLSGKLPASIDAGSPVELWSAAVGESQHFDRPEVLVGSATVVRLLDDDALVASSTAVSVELQIPRSRTSAVLDAIANGSSLSLIPATSPVER